jgi:hypothetical protein
MEDDIQDVFEDPSTIANYVNERWQKYGQKFLNLCIKYRITDQPASSR